MSWLFGGGSNPPPDDGDEDFDDVVEYYDDDDDDRFDDDVSNTRVISDFDASALVEGAKVCLSLTEHSGNFNRFCIIGF